ncbi:MAG: phosphoenolpyruvate-utilizing N-terminal domain-containing protein [Ruminococcus sp.]
MSSAFAGIAIGKIRFYRKGEYQIRQHQADDVKRELRSFDVARRHVMQTLKEEYDRMSDTRNSGAGPASWLGQLPSGGGA